MTTLILVRHAQSAPRPELPEPEFPLSELGCRTFIETPPGTVLSRLVKDAFPEARALALEEVPLATAVALAARA